MEDTKIRNKINSLIDTRFDIIKDDLCIVLMDTEIEFLTIEFIAYNKKDFSVYYEYIRDIFRDKIDDYLSRKSMDITITHICIDPFKKEIDRYMKKFIKKEDDKSLYKRMKEIIDIFDYSFLHMLDKDNRLDRYTKLRLFKYINSVYNSN